MSSDVWLNFKLSLKVKSDGTLVIETIEAGTLGEGEETGEAEGNAPNKLFSFARVEGPIMPVPFANPTGDKISEAYFS